MCISRFTFGGCACAFGSSPHVVYLRPGLSETSTNSRTDSDQAHTPHSALRSLSGYDVSAAFHSVFHAVNNVMTWWVALSCYRSSAQRRARCLSQVTWSTRRRCLGWLRLAMKKTGALGWTGWTTARYGYCCDRSVHPCIHAPSCLVFDL